MTVETDEDRAALLADFGVSVTWTRDGVAQTPFVALFNRPSITFRDDDPAPATARKAFLVCREADLPPGAAEDDPVTVADEAATYACARVLPDGTGFCVVDLKVV